MKKLKQPKDLVNPLYPYTEQFLALIADELNVHQVILGELVYEMGLGFPGYRKGLYYYEEDITHG